MAKMLGYDKPETVLEKITNIAKQIYVRSDDRQPIVDKQLQQSGITQHYNHYRRADGSEFFANLYLKTIRDKAGQPLYLEGIVEDITERKLQEDAHEATARFITLVNTPSDLRKCMSDLTSSLQLWSGCEAVGIRLRAGDDYPYYETRGFPPEFVDEENSLCAYDPDGKILRDGLGNPFYECMCGNILSGRFDSSKPFFTASGSFWSNNTTALLASTTDADRQTRTRNRCNGEGYESVALIPLRYGDQVFGLLQFNDHRTGRFTSGLITNFERMADNLAIALSRRRAEEALRESEERLREFFEHETSYCYRISPDGIILDLNPSAMLALGYPSKDDLVGKSIITTVYAPASQDRARQLLLRWKETGKLSDEEITIITKTGEERTVILNVSAVRNIEGRILYSVSIQTDINERKMAEVVLRAKMEELQRFQRLTVDRELNMIDLKKEVNMLLNQAGKEEKYTIIDEKKVKE